MRTVSPLYGDVFGGYDITLQGDNLNVGNSTILIDGIRCVVSATTSTSIKCTVGSRLKTPSAGNTFTVTIGTYNAILLDKFTYIMRWSDGRTWGVDIPPIDGDLVFIPKGMSLLVDQSTPILLGIIVEGGNLIFSDEKDMVVQAGFITMNGGTFIAGTQAKPYTNKLTFIMHGNYYGKQQPMFGNKGIGCLNCKFYMYGAPRTPTWTTLSATINPGDTSFTVNDNIDWKVGE